MNKLIKIKAIFLLLFFSFGILNAQNFILNDGSLLDSRAKQKINEIGNEVKDKLGFNIYLYIQPSLLLKQNATTKEKIESVKKLENKLIKDLNSPYVLMTVYIEENIVNLLYSKDAINIVNKNDILDNYVVPLLASKDKNALYSKVSAATLNGYAAIADNIADKKNIALKSSIGSEGKISGTIWRVFIYTLVVVGLFAYTYAILRKREK